MAINVKDFEKIEKELTHADRRMLDKYETLLRKYTGPGVGLTWDVETGKLSVASDWHIDENGDVVRNA